MKRLMLTGLATEHSFTKGGTEQYFLVFNDGEVRIPVPQQTAEAVIQELYSGAEQEQSAGFTQEEIEEQRQAMQEENRQQSQGIVMGTVGNTYSGTDEDGVDQV